ncbi:SDR family NAD(P)-dependent oxidoreductase [Oceaniglobus ichthyenteri]|uniref:SDR family NAD(P)-dependent oxidoreductase n=1 Tax=Oceaniglobus ichthyenteri TaxID=2136177 RepID=UPI000D3A2CDE|nr:SDR family oxidoreductase [Oceaniglobus ichthyenteri]
MTATFPDLRGASVFITGGGAGIGAALTDGFMAQGARVAFLQRSDATAFCDAMEAKHGTRPWFQPCDVTDIAALQSTLADAARANGPITVLINNAASDQRHSTMDLTPEAWDHLQNINLRPFVFATQAVVPGMRANGGGAVINISSISYMMGMHQMPAYTTAKAGINALTRAHAREFGTDNIRINTLTPGMVLTDRQLAEVVSEPEIERHIATQCLPVRFGPDAVVGPALFLASDASRMMTGQALVVDGGVVTTG